MSRNLGVSLEHEKRKSKENEKINKNKIDNHKKYQQRHFIGFRRRDAIFITLYIISFISLYQLRFERDKHLWEMDGTLVAAPTIS